MTSPTFIVGSVEYLGVRFTADVVIDDTQTVEIKLNGTWRAATWVGAAATTRVAHALVDFTPITAGTYAVYGRIHDTPEIPIIAAGTIKVKAAA